MSAAGEQLKASESVNDHVSNSSGSGSVNVPSTPQATTSGGGLHSTLQAKLATVLAMRTSDSELIQALKHVSILMNESASRPIGGGGGVDVLPVSDTGTERVQLRGALEARDVVVNQRLLALFGDVQAELERVEAQVVGMRQTCTALDARLQHTKRVSGALIAQTDALARQRARTQAQRQMAAHFLERFQLSDAELAALKASELRVPFFAALARVRRIHSECKLLLRTQHQRAGLEIMDSMAMHQEAAYRRLYRWVKSECNSALADDAPELHALLPLALDALRERVVLHGYALEDIGRTRGAALGQAFAAALTAGGPGGVPRPIEMHAHDPLRYVGDMLGWLHQAVASEFEFVSNILHQGARKSMSTNALAAANGDGDDGGGDNGASDAAGDVNDGGDAAVSVVPSQPQAPMSAVVRADLVRVLDAACETVATPFKTRCEHLLSTNLASTIVYRLIHLLDFYARTVAALLSDDAVLVRTIRELKVLAATRFETALRAAGERMLRQPPPCTSQLTPAYEVQRATSQLAELMTTFEGSLVPAAARAAEFAPVLDAVVTPLVRACAAGAASLAPAERATYAANCADMLANVLAPFSFAAAHRDALRRAAGEHVDVLLQAAFVALLVHCSLVDATTPTTLEADVDVLAAADRLGAAAATRLSSDALWRAVDTMIATWTGNDRDVLGAVVKSAPGVGAVALLSDVQRRRDASAALRQRILRFYTALHAGVNGQLRYAPQDVEKLLGDTQ